MIKIKFKPQALAELKSFIRHYEEAFYELYKDSGIWSENFIIAGYMESAKKLYLAILQQIESRLSARRVLGRKEFGLWFELNFYIGNRLVIVYYSQGKATRFIESISIDRKPIIF